MGGVYEDYTWWGVLRPSTLIRMRKSIWWNTSRCDFMSSSHMRCCVNFRSDSLSGLFLKTVFDLFFFLFFFVFCFFLFLFFFVLRPYKWGIWRQHSGANHENSRSMCRRWHFVSSSLPEQAHSRADTPQSATKTRSAHQATHKERLHSRINPMDLDKVACGATSFILREGMMRRYNFQPQHTPHCLLQMCFYPQSIFCTLPTHYLLCIWFIALKNTLYDALWIVTL